LYCLGNNELVICEREREIKERRESPVPWLEELDPVAIGEGDGVSVEGERMAAVKLPITTAWNPRSGGSIGEENGA
jgi:hypothetical protein